MAGRTKKKAAKKAVKKAKKTKKAKRPVKAAARKAAAKKAPVKKAAKKAAKKSVKKKKASRGEFGEGNYKASKRFRASEEAFVKKNKAKIPALGKAAEAALEGSEGDELRAAEAAAAAGHPVGES